MFVSCISYSIMDESKDSPIKMSLWVSDRLSDWVNRGAERRK